MRSDGGPPRAKSTGPRRVGATRAADADLCPTKGWLAEAGGLPALEGPAGTAERLLLLLHYGIDWQGGWVGARRRTYWERLLPDRVVVATYRAANLRRWWSEVAGELESAPRNAAERAELEMLLRSDPRPVLDVLRWETEPLLLRVRLVADAVRAGRGSAS